MEIEGVFGQISELGPAQVKLFLLVSIPGPWIAFHTFITNFIGSDPGWTCSVYTNSGASNCSDGGGARSGCTNSGGLPVLITDPEEKCRHYESGDCLPQFDTSEYTSIVSEWDLICGRSSYPNLSQSAFFLGLMIGAWLFGSLSDVYGRKKIAFLALLGCICMGLGYSLASNFLVFALFRLLFGLTKQGFIVAAFTLIVEVVGASKRTFVTIINQAIFTAGICALPLLSYYIRRWRTLSISISLLGIGFLSVWRWIPESPRWLLVQGREEEAKAVLAQIARGNGRRMTVSRLKRPSSKPSETTVSVTALFRTPVIRHRTLILLVTWFTNCIVYYGLSLSAGSLGGGRYISVALSGLVELPGLYINYHLLNRVGRRWTQGGFLTLAGICCVLWALGHWAGCGKPLTLALALAGKCAVGNSFCALYLFSAELFPTEVRSLGMGVVSVASRLGGIMSPIILIMGGVSLGLPMVVMGCLGLLAGLLSLHLPETLHQPLPETLAELEHQAHSTISTYPQISKPTRP